MTTLTEKVGLLLEGESVPEPTECFAVPGKGHIIDCVHPLTGKSVIYGCTLEEVRALNPGAQIIKIDEWLAARAAEQDSPIEWDEITREQYENWLECLPPAAYARTFTGFLVGEPSDHHMGNGRPRYQACRIRDGKYWASSRPLKTLVAEFHRGTR